MRSKQIVHAITFSWFQTLGYLTSVLVMILLVIPSSANAQNRVTINSAEEVIGVTMQGERVRKLIGDVSLKTQNMVMYCDSAYQYLEKSEVKAFGNIEIDTPEEQIYADTLTYFTDVDFSQLRGRVVIEADSATLFSQALDYRFSTKVGHFIKNVRLEDPDGVLTANSGFYYREPDSAVFRGNVQLTDSVKYAEGDSLFINRRKNTYRLYGNIFVDDRENSVMLKGDSLKADSVGHRFLEGNAWLQKVDTQPQSAPDTTTASTDTAFATADSATSGSALNDINLIPDWYLLEPTSSTRDTLVSPGISSEGNSNSAPDTTHIQARIIHSIQTDTQTVINAYRNVRIWSPKFSAISDTAYYNDESEVFKLRSNPIAWHKQIQLTGPYIELQLADGEIDELISYRAPFVVQQDTALDRLNQVTGDTLIANFTDGDISRIHVYPNSHLLRFTKNENDQPDGAVDMTSPSIRIFFENGQLVEMKAQGPVDGMYLPESQQTAERRLTGFVWTPKQRPQKPAEPMQRRLPPIPEDPPFELPLRYVDDHQGDNE